MMKKWSGLFAVLAAVGIIAAAVFFAGSKSGGERGAVTLWYVEGSSLADALKECTEMYNSSSGRAGLPIEMCPFESEEKLAEAFELNSPDILLCAHTRAFSLREREKLTDISADLTCSPRYPKSITDRNACIGKSFFPVGLEVPVLIVNRSLWEKTSFDSMEAMLSDASAYTSDTGKAFFGCDSFSKLFALAMLRSGKEFRADFENESGKAYTDLYNTFARAAFEGSMYPVSGNMASYVTGGALPCAIVDSSSLAGADVEGISVSDVPSPVNSVSRDTPGTAYGLAITNGGSRSTAAIGAFLSWFFENGKCGECARKTAMAPAETLTEAASDALSQTLSAIVENAIVSLADPSSPYAANSGDFDVLFSAAMQKLH